MTTTERFTTHCPSCDAGVAVKVALVGKKIECPKCKFRFVVPEAPAADPATDGKAPAAPKSDKASAATDEKADPTAKGKGKGKKGKEKAKAKEKKGGGNGKVIIGAVAGVFALVGLVVGAVLIFGKSGDKTASNTSKPTTQIPGPGGPGGPNTGIPQPDGGDVPGPIGPGGPGGPNPGGPGGPNPGGPGGGEQPGGPGGGEQPGGGGGKPKPPSGPSGTDITNLLPGDTMSVLRVRMDDLAKNAPGLRNAVFDKATGELFERAMNFKHTDIAEFIQCEVGADRDPFVVFRTKADLEDDMFSQPRMDTTRPDNSTIQGRQFRLVNANAFLTAAERSLGLASVFGLAAHPADGAKGKEVKYAICLYDPRTLIVAEHRLMEGFLTGLKENGYPEYKTEYKGPAEPPKEQPEPGKGGPDGPPSGPPSGPPGGGGGGGPTYGPPGGGGSSGGPPGGIPPQQPGGGGGPPGGLPPITPGTGGTPVGPPGGGGQPGGGVTPPKPKKSIHNNPTFCTIEARLKKALNALEDESKDMPAAVYVEKIDQTKLQSLDLETIAKNPELLIAFDVLGKVKVMGASVTRVNDKRSTLHAYLEYGDDSAAKTSVEGQLVPLLQLLASKAPTKLGKVDVVDLNTTGGTPGGGGTPGYPGGGPSYPGGGGGPSYPGSGGGYPPGGPGGGGIPGPITPGTGGGGPGGGGKEPGPEASAPKYKPGTGGGFGFGFGNGDELAQGPRPGGPPGPITPGTGGGTPGGEGGPTYPGGPGGPGYPGGPGGPGYPGGPGGTPSTPTGNRIEVYRDGSTVTLTAEFTFKDDAFAAVVEPLLARQGALVRGKMGMYSGESGVFALAARLVDGKPTGGLVEKAFAAGQLPPGALDRDASADGRKLPGSARGLPYPPEQRCSFFAELIKYMDNKGGVYTKIDPRGAWYQGKNLEAAEAWIPELLVPDYPQSSWRATSDLVPDGRTIGGTNYVGVSGLGLDSARYDPKNPDHAKKVGLFGYDWGSKPEEVKDGLANTMYLIQVPPTYSRPWMAGGGATVMGVDDKGTDPVKPFLHKQANGVRGTTVLMGDGSVRFVKEGIDPKVFRAMSTRAGEEKMDDFDKVVPPATPPGAPGELKGGK